MWQRMLTASEVAHKEVSEQRLWPREDLSLSLGLVCVGLFLEAHIAVPTQDIIPVAHGGEYAVLRFAQENISAVF